MAKKKLSKKKRRRRMIRRLILLTILLALVTVLAVLSPKIIKVIKLAQDAKQIVAASTVDTFRESGTTVIYDAEGNELCTMRESKDMYYVDISQIPEGLQDAFVVMEDKDFYKHKGIDFKAIIRAIIANTENDEIVQGASTITQQLAKNIFLSQEVTWERKVKEIFVARELEKKYSKKQILEFYLNNIYFANGYYGVGAAAKGYFSKEAGELSLSEQAFIAAIPNNPSRYNPLTNFDKTKERRDNILTRLYNDDYINSMNYYTAVDSEVVLSQQPVASKNNSVETYARHCATEGMMQANGFVFRTNFISDYDYEEYRRLYEESYTVFQQKLLSGGYMVYTSIDMGLQEKLQSAVDDNLKNYTSQKDGVYEMQSSATCIDNTTGNVVAIVGSRSQELEGYTLNRAYQSYRQPGSSIKPLIDYLPYLEKGNNPDTIVTDEYIQDGPKNADGTYMGDITLRTAVSLSRNTVAWNILKEIGTRVGSSYLINQGFHKVWMDKEYNAISIGGFTYGVSTEEMAGAYATIANDGDYRRATCVVSIIDRNGKTVLDTSNRSEKIYDTEACRMMTDMLKSVVTDGTGRGAVPDNVIVAGKTGTTNSNYDSWFCGYSAYYTVAVWQGYDYPASIPQNCTIGIFRQFMEQAHKGLVKKDFPKYRSKGGQQQSTGETETETETHSVSETESASESSKNDESTSQRETGVIIDNDEIITKPSTTEESGSTASDGIIVDPDKPAETKTDNLTY
ncbi:MAG: transglycosylase domain-containing protein [Clostridia bacterium]|nr:transglycosylase domain-containing protein [Clostridia bacterium]